MLRIRVLGELELEAGGARLEVPAGRPARALLGWLALHPGIHARAAVAGGLWPDVREESARGSLRTALSLLRAGLGEAAADALVATREHVGLAGRDAVWVDAVAFAEFVREGRHEDALALWRGDLLPGLHDDWVLVARDEHRDLCAQALGALADAAQAAGDHAAALRLARRQVALDPLGEPAQRDLMRRLAAAGDRAGALEVYARLADRLRRQLGVAPSSETRALAHTLRQERERPARPAAGPQLPARLVAARRRGPLAGREAPLARLRALWARAGPGPTVAALCGEPGIGKTRLAAELAAELHREGVAVLYGRAEEEPLAPYAPFAEALGAPLPEEPDAGGAAAVGARLRLFDAIAAALERRAGGRPLLLVLDDLHWADRPTLRLLAHVARREREGRTMIVATYRQTEIGPDHPLTSALADLRRDVPVEQVALGGLGEDAIAALAEHWAGHLPSREAVRALGAQTGGNPFFVEQLAGDLDAGQLERLPVRPAPVPVGAAQAVAQRVARLGPQGGALLAAGALAGPEFDLDVARDVVGLSADAALDLLDAAVRARIVTEVAEAPGRYAFVHALARDALTGELTAARRARLHGLLAAALEARAREDPDRHLRALAHHALEAAVDPDRAVEVAERAAARASALLAHEDAAALLERALILADRHGMPARRRAELRCALGEALQRAGEARRGRECFAAAAELARAAGDAALLGRAALGSGGLGVTILGVDRALVARLEEALEALGEDGGALRVRLLARLAIELAYDPGEARRERASVEAVQGARALGDAGALAAALNARHVALWGPDHTAARLACAGEMLEAARRAGDRELELQALHWRVLDLFEAGDGSGVRAALDAYAEAAAQSRLITWSWYVPQWRATLAVLEGRLDEGAALARRARELGRRAADANADVFHAEHTFMRLQVEGRVRELEPAAIDVGDQVWARAARGPASSSYRCSFAWVDAERGNLDAARRGLAEAAPDGFAALPRDVNWLTLLSSATEVCVRLGDAGLARELHALLEPYADRMVVSGRASAHAGCVARRLAVLAATFGDHAEAEARFMEAHRRDAAAGAAVWAQRDREGLAALRTAGQAPPATML